MIGISYNRHESSGDEESWHQPTDGETIIVNKEAYLRFFPKSNVLGEEGNQCTGEDRCGACSRCCRSVEIRYRRMVGYTAVVHAISGETPTHEIGEFKWEWDGHAATEHWFDGEAICLAKTDDYRSESGLTAHSVRVVAYKRRVEIKSFRRGIEDAKIFPKAGRIWAEFKNKPSEYRANWTGFAIGYPPKDEYGGINPTPVVSDDLDGMIEAMLNGQLGAPVVCKHNPNVQVHVLTAEPSKLSFLLCKACRMQGVRWAEFSGRNRMDTCPYFRRACKSVVDKSDPFPRWFTWSGDNLLSSALRMKDGEHTAYEVAYIRRKDGFIRRAVLLCNERTHEVWMYRYGGFVPRTAMEFFGKYAEGRQINGYLGIKPREYCNELADRFLSEAKVATAVAKGLKQPLWQDENEESKLIVFDPGSHVNTIADMATQNGVEINGIQIVQLNQEGKPCEMKDKESPAPFYTDAEADYYLIYSDWSCHTALCRSGVELYRSERDRGEYFLLRIMRKEGL